ncbi:MAG: FxsA family protein [Acidimicrobiales bacterium]
MSVLLLLLFIVVPILELYVIIQVADGIGVVETIVLLILVSVVGAWLVKREGLSVLRKVQTELARGQMPTKQIVDGALIMLAGALMLTPGFVTDAVGVLFLIPPTRALFRRLIMSRFRGRVQVASFGPGGGFRTGPVVDVQGTETVDLVRDDNPENPPPSLPSDSS